jgi:hypothetical protein
MNRNQVEKNKVTLSVLCLEGGGFEPLRFLLTSRVCGPRE